MHPTWHSLPTEIKIAVAELLPIDNVKVLSKVDQEASTICVPITFKVRLSNVLPDMFQTSQQHVKLIDFETLQCFLAHVPRSYYRYIHQLDICTTLTIPAKVAFAENATLRTDAVVSLLGDCINLQKLSLQLSGGLARHAIPCFTSLHNLKELSISNCASEWTTPM
jgi:hypothetical protein